MPITNVTDSAVILMSIDAHSFPDRFFPRDAYRRAGCESCLMPSFRRRLASAFIVPTGLDR